MCWKALYLVKEDRNMIPIGRRNGQPVYGRHIPYWAGLLVYDSQKDQAFLLDPYNAEILLSRYLQRDEGAAPVLPLSLLLSDHPEIRKQIGTITCRDVSAWQKHCQIKRLPRDAHQMISMAAHLQLRKGDGR